MEDLSTKAQYRHYVLIGKQNKFHLSLSLSLNKLTEKKNFVQLWKKKTKPEKSLFCADD
jgi:hypothetical protein